MKQLWLALRRLGTKIAESGPVRQSDSGLFDPFVPIGRLKRLSGDLTEEASESVETAFVSEAQPPRNFAILRAVAVVLSLVVGGRLVALQITQGQEHYLLAEGNRLQVKPIAAPRGLIMDRRGVTLVRNAPSFQVVLNISDLPAAQDSRDALIESIAAIVGVAPADLATRVAESKNAVIALKEGLDRETALSYEVKLFGTLAVDIIKSPNRDYLSLPSLGHLAGYTGRPTSEDRRDNPELLPTALVGRSGLERSYDRLLQGIAGAETLEVDSLGRTVRSVGNKLPRVGQSLILGLDSVLQQTAAKALAESITASQAKSGAVVVLDVHSGEILSMVSLPDFNNNVFTTNSDASARQALLNDPGSPLLNRAIAGQYPSGSTIKPTIAAAALDSGVINSLTRLDTSEGKIIIGQWTFSDWKTHGSADVRQAIAESNNIFFYAVGGGYKQITGLGAERLARYLGVFGFGKKTGLDVPGEQSGHIPTPDWKKKNKGEAWYIGDTYNLSIGQGDLLVTPLQLARSTAAIANGGKLLRPRLVKRILSSSGELVQEMPTVIDNERLVRPEYLQTVREGMRRAVTDGSARSFAALKVEVAAKTGTAQFDKAKEKTHSWFTAFAPYQDPEIALAVIVEGGGEGFAVAAPVAKNIIEQYFRLPITLTNPAEHQ